MKIAVTKKVSKNGSPYVALLIIRGEKEYIVSFDLVTIMKVSGLSYQRIEDMKINENIFI